MARHGSFLFCALVLSVAGCSVSGCRVGDDPGPMRDAGTGRSDGGTHEVPGCDPSIDMDGDGIADQADGVGDPDMDGIINQLDDDSDGDGFLDSDEHAGLPPCVYRDTDGDLLSDHLDRDSDNDGATDDDERDRYATDPYDADTDDDGVYDLVEVYATGADPRDPARGLDPGDYFVILPYGSGPVIRELDFGTSIRVADIYFLVDTTGSMQPVIDNVTATLADIASAVAADIPDVQMGVGHFEDFPFGPLITFYGNAGDEPYAHLQDITDDVGAVRTALEGITLGMGGDGPESGVFALTQTATGEGGTWMFTASPPATWSLDRRICPEWPDERRPRIGYPCFRPGALPIVVLVTDLEWHNGSESGMRHPYANISPIPPTLISASVALNNIGGRFIGVPVQDRDTLDYWPTDHEAVCRMTGSLDAAGDPLVYPALAGNVDESIIEGIHRLADETPMLISTAQEDVAPNPHDIDATEFIISVVPLSASPASGITGMDEEYFYGVTPGTRVRFTVTFENTFVMPPPIAEVYRAIIVVLGNRTARLDERRVFIVVPPYGEDILI